MISFADNIFRLSTRETSYWFRVTHFGHLEHICYGRLLPEDQPVKPLVLKRTARIGDCVDYDPDDETYCLDTLCLEWSGVGKGDYRETPAEIKMPDGTFTADFVYQSHKITGGSLGMETLPSSYGGEEDCETLEITMLDLSNNVTLLLNYTVYATSNVITRRAVLINGGKTPLTIHKLMSMSVDIPDDNYRLLTLDGGWIKEANKHERKLSYGIHINSSTTGSSSNRHNPAFMLASGGATETSGGVYGFNLVYSGNHYSAVELSNHDVVRVQTGVNPHCFSWTLEENGRFETPESLMSYSGSGFNGLSHNFHDFINNHIVRGEWKNRERPIVFNNWEAHFFKFDRSKLLNLARRARNVGVELFVLDDGWFGKRDDAKAGLGDYTVNQKKLPGGLADFSGLIHEMGLKFGLWFEPEMVNEDSDLYREHPEYALKTPGKQAALGRNQLVLDLCNPEVRDYIVENVSRILDDCGVDYVKWDCNRHISDACSTHLDEQGRFFHTYMIGLYDVLGRIFKPRPHILFESCASGGNRFDAGMLCYSPQIWTSDDTDPIERLKIQGGLSYMYPLSAMGAHVSAAPHQQTLRDVPLPTRFNVAAFGCLGYELDLKYLSGMELEEVKEQIAFYKQHRRTLQYGRFWRGEFFKDNKVVWHCVSKAGDGSLSYQRQDAKQLPCACEAGKPPPGPGEAGKPSPGPGEAGKPPPSPEKQAAEPSPCLAEPPPCPAPAYAVTGFFQTLSTASEGFDRLRLMGLDPHSRYIVTTKPQRLFIKRFGGLTRHILPIALDPDGMILRAVNKRYSLADCAESYEAYGQTLMDGIMLSNQYLGTGYNEQTRLLGDFGSTLYVVELMASR